MKLFFSGLVLSLVLLVLAGCSFGGSKSTQIQTITETATLGTIAATATPMPTITSPKPSPSAPELPTAAPTTEPVQQGAPVESPTATEVAPVGASEPTPTTAAPTQVEKTCKDVAAFYGDVSIPDGTSFRAGDAFTKTWRFRNNGDCTWTTAYNIVFFSGEIMNAPLAVPFPADVPPGKTVELSIDMQAPTRGGEHTGNWEFADENGRHFAAGLAGSDRFWVSIIVSYMDQNGVALPMPAPGAAGGATSSAGANAVAAGCGGVQNRDYQSQVIVLINQSRLSNGLPALRENSQLDAAALDHSADMACNNFLNHTGSDGSTWYDRLRVQGYVYNKAYENIYAGDPQFGGDPQGAMTWWMNSQVHRDNILNPQATEIGVGYVSNPGSQYTGYYTVNFARP